MWRGGERMAGIVAKRNAREKSVPVGWLVSECAPRGCSRKKYEIRSNLRPTRGRERRDIAGRGMACLASIAQSSAPTADVEPVLGALVFERRGQAGARQLQSRLPM